MGAYGSPELLPRDPAPWPPPPPQRAPLGTVLLSLCVIIAALVALAAAFVVVELAVGIHDENVQMSHLIAPTAAP